MRLFLHLILTKTLLSFKSVNRLALNRDTLPLLKRGAVLLLLRLSMWWLWWWWRVWSEILWFLKWRVMVLWDTAVGLRRGYDLRRYFLVLLMIYYLKSKYVVVDAWVYWEEVWSTDSSSLPFSLHTTMECTATIRSQTITQFETSW